jgi:hypothetical protein
MKEEERTNLIWTVSKMVTHNPRNQPLKKCSKEGRRIVKTKVK